MGNPPPPPTLPPGELERRYAAGARTMRELDPALAAWVDEQHRLAIAGRILIVVTVLAALAIGLMLEFRGRQPASLPPEESMSDNTYNPDDLADLASFHAKYSIDQTPPAPVDEWPEPATAVLIGIDFVTNTVTYEFGDLRALQQKRPALVDNWVTVLVEDSSEDVFITGAWSETRLCRVCGCSDDLACEEGCSWVEDDLCSACANQPTA